MKTKFITFGWLLATFLILGGVAVSALPDKEDKLIKITKKRLPMAKQLATLCIGPQAVVGPHLSPEVDIFVNEAVLSYRKMNPKKFDYPIGSTFVKHKYPTVGAEKPDIATIMVKKESKGVVTDWEFTMESLPDGKPIQQKARISCADCHDRFEDQGFISNESEWLLRDYLGIAIEVKANRAK